MSRKRKPKKTEEENLLVMDRMSMLIENRCLHLITRKYKKRFWIYLKNKETLKTNGIIRLNKMSIGVLYVYTKLDFPLEEFCEGFESKDYKTYYSNKITIKSRDHLLELLELLNELKFKELLYNK